MNRSPMTKTRRAVIVGEKQSSDTSGSDGRRSVAGPRQADALPHAASDCLESPHYLLSSTSTSSILPSPFSPVLSGMLKSPWTTYASLSIRVMSWS